MMRVSVLIPLVLAVFVCTAVPAFTAAPVSEEQKIAMLIDYVRSLKGSLFIRNGTEYPPEQAAEHLAMKRKKAGSRVKTAREFIDRVASESYLSGEPYVVRLPDGSIVRSKDLLLRRLAVIESAK